MADEAEKKAFVLNKKKSDATTDSKNESTAVASSQGSGAAEKKRVVVVKRKNPAQDGKSSAPVSAGDQSHDGAKVRPVVKRPAPNSSAVSPSSNSNNGNAQGSGRPQNVNRSEGRPRQNAPFELTSARPNVKAGNLSDRPRNGGYNRGGYSNRDNGYQGNRPYNGQRREGGFTGAQARESYQNRERDGNRPNNGFNRSNGQGGYQGNRPNGGFNRGPNGTGGRPGFNRGPNGAGGRPGFGGPRPGFGGPRPGFGGGAAPSAIPENRTAGKKKAFQGKKQVYTRKDKEELFDEDELYGNKKKQVTPASVVPKSIEIMDSVSVSDLARKMNLKASDIIGKLMSQGMMVTINQSIDSDTASLIAMEYGCEVKIVSLYDETVIESDKGVEGAEQVRPPIVTVMGHVDHGKTKTLDAIRKTNVVAGEAGGITQKIGAYQVSTPKGDITFLDTPGHEAFTMMRARGAQITDIVVLVVAADDGVMPQTLEALSHAKDAKVPIIVAVNKVDKPDANPDKVMTQLSERGLTPEEWGGDTQYVKISALKGEGIDDLLDAILLQAEVLELKSQYDCRAEGKIIESRVDQGRGVVASVVVQRGTLKIGDPFVAGIYSGRVRAMFNDRGEKVTEAGPSMPVEVLGIDEMPNAGDPFQVTESEKDARAISSKRQELKRLEAAKAVKKTTLDSIFTDIANREVDEFKVIIKADLQGSAEALKASLEKLSTPEIRLVVIHSSAGAINESDVTLAAADSNAIIIGFNVRPTPKAKLLADQEKVDIRKYNIIYKCVEEIQQAMEGRLRPDTKEVATGTIEVRNTFRVPKVGLIAGCYVTDGIVKRTSSVNLIRDGIVKFTGKITSLKRFKDDAKEVKAGFECGIGLENWQDIQVGDTLEAFEYVEVARKLGDALVDDKAENEKAAAERAAAAEAEAEAKAAAEAAAEAEAKAKGKAQKAARKSVAEEGNN